MPCSSPLYAVRVLSKPHKNGVIDICRVDSKTGEIRPDNVFFSKKKVYYGGLSGREARDAYVEAMSSYMQICEPVDYACGKCIACRMRQAAEWTTRLALEYQTSNNALFLTFTYDDDHLPHSPLGFPTLCYNDIRQFNQNLTNVLARKFCMESARHFICGEYGTQTLRPHYHSIHFNLPMDSAGSMVDPLGLKVKFVRAGLPYYTSELLSECWGKGFVVVSGFSPDAAGYVARYVTKKLNGELNKQRFESTGVLQEKTWVSNKPGIGRVYYELNKDAIYKWDQIFLPGKGAVPVPAYYDHLFGDIDLNLSQLDEIKAKRVERASIIQDAEMAKFRDPYSYLESINQKYKNIMSKLPRYDM